MNTKQKPVYLWLWLGAAIITLLVIIGGITRLTGSGLSITEWNVFMGTIPPLNDADWQSEFLKYQQIPQFKEINANMTLEGFKFIYFWEYLHRLIARSLGMIFIIPLAFFWFKNYLNPKLKRQLIFLMILGGLQGGMGWFMVKSGLSELNYVSHYRLAAHLMMALLLLGSCVWIAQNIKFPTSKHLTQTETSFKKGVVFIGVLLVLQLIWGAFTAGLHAGFQYNTFPLMYGELTPMNMWSLKPAILNLTQNPGTVQWVHRLLGISLWIGAGILQWISIQNKELRALKKSVLQFNALITLQVILGISTLLYFTPIELAVPHQLLAAIVWIRWVLLYHEQIFETKKV